MKKQIRTSGLQATDALFREGDVITIPHEKSDGTVEDRPALVTRIGDDGSGHDRSTIHYAFIEPDGGIGGGSGHVNEWNTKGIKHIDFAKVRTVVDLPPEWQKVAFEFDKRQIERQQKMRDRMDEDEPETHPSYATVVVGRCQGQRSLFMSPFHHQHFMTLSIHRADRRRSLSNDHTFGGVELIEVALSEAQWARLVSSAGIGSGTPATLTRLGGSLVQECPQQADLSRFHNDVEKRMKAAAESLNDAVSRAEALLNAKTASKAERQQVLDSVQHAKREIEGGLPFIATQLRERMEHIVSEGKTEIEAFAQRTITSLGLQKLAGEFPVASSLSLTPGKDDKK